MATGQIMPRGNDEKAARRAKQLRDAVQARAKEKNIPLLEAMEEILKEGNFVGFTAEQRRATELLQAEKQAGKGWGRDAFARAVSETTVEIMRREPALPQRDAFLKATGLVIRENRHALSDYRSDVEEL